MSYQEVIQQIMNDYKFIKFIFIYEGDQYCQANGQQYYINNCYQIDKEIYVGIYQNESFKLMGILHEIGHFVQPYKEYCTKFMQQLQSWKQTYRLAKHYSIQITPQMTQYSEKCLKSYNKNYCGLID